MFLKITKKLQNLKAHKKINKIYKTLEMYTLTPFSDNDKIMTTVYYKCYKKYLERVFCYDKKDFF